MYFGTIGSPYHTSVATRTRFASGTNASDLEVALATLRKAIAEEPNGEQLLTDFENLTGKGNQPSPPPQPPEEPKA